MKFPKLFSKQKPTQEIQVFGIEFLSEQDGPNEKLLKEKLSTMFRAKESIESAIWCERITKHQTRQESRCAFGRVPARTRSWSNPFMIYFDARLLEETLLDIMFPSDRQLVEIEKVCKPFYRRDSDV
jgi:hypothetical protein